MYLRTQNYSGVGSSSLSGPQLARSASISTKSCPPLLTGRTSTNPDFVNEVKNAGMNPDATILFLCRSGQRSISAAIAMTDAGYENSYNILEGFEGDKDEKSQRGTVGGWKLSGLSWQQS